MSLVTSAFFSILLNGVPSGTFKPSRGIRQGDPLSPFLFILMEEGLGRSIVASWKSNDIIGLRIHSLSSKQTHQQFVDDTMLMGHPSVQDVLRFKKYPMEFGKASRLETNDHKYEVFFFNMPRITRQNIYRMLGFQESSLPSKYLGTPLVNSLVKRGS